MWPDLELESEWENINDPAFSGEKVLEQVQNGGGDVYGRDRITIEQTSLCNGNNDEVVNITECKNSGKALEEKDSLDDVTESSSSFGDTGSGSENAVAASFCDLEVESKMFADSASSSMCDDWHEELFRPRKRRTTDHWRRFIRPTMWRCKWLELQMKLLESQAHKYYKELEALNYTKQVDYAHLTLDSSDIKSVPISGRMHKTKIMKRKNRKRVEKNCDLASYMSNHTLFSYYEKADCNVDLRDCHAAAIGGDSGNAVEFKLNDLGSSIDIDDNDKSWYEIIQEIEATQTRVQKLKNRYDMMIKENQGRFCFANQSSIPGPSDGLCHSDIKPAPFSGDAGIIPLIKSADSPKLDDPLDDVAKEELQELENAGYELVKKTKEIAENKAISEIQVSEPYSTENAVHNVNMPSTSKSNISRNKRKGKKKSSSKRSRIFG